MRKGDEKKAEILQVAERLFCSRGYEATGIQDLLDVLHTSKGGFYHHFASKEAVLKALCEQRAEKQVERCAEVLNTTVGSMQRINTLLAQVMPLQRDELAFAAMLLPALGSPETLSVRTAYQEALAEAFRAPLEAELAAASADGTIHPVTKNVAEPVLLLINRCWYEAAMYLNGCIKTTQRYEPAALMQTLEWCRRCIEVLLDAPYGSVVVLKLDEWNTVAENIIRRLKL